MRVVHLHRMRGIGGSERHVLTLLPALRDLGLDARFVGLDDERGHDPTPFYAALDEKGAPYVRLSSPLRLRRALRRADVVHTHLVHADAYGALAAGRSRVVSTKHNDDRFRVGPFRYVERALTRRAEQVICTTHALARFNADRVGLPAEKLVVIHYGLDAAPEPWGENPPLELPEGKVVAAVARLVPQKGLDVAVRAMAGLDASLVVLGEGPERPRLEALARALDVRLSLPGRVADVAAVLRQAHVLVHPARWEGFGLALLEAMLCGLPVVATHVSSIPEIVADGETGLLVPPDDPVALSAALRQAFAEHDRLGAAGLERARRDFSVEQMARRTLEVYTSPSSRSAHDPTE